MRVTLLFAILLAVLLNLTSMARAQNTPKELQPRLFSLAQNKVSVQDTLKQIEQQTGNAVVDRRRLGDTSHLKLHLKDATFWQALDAVCSELGCSYSLSQVEGKVALVDGVHRKMAVSYEGVFRLAVKRIAVVRDEETGLRFCNVTVDVAWEPRLFPFYLNVGPGKVVFASDANNKVLKADYSARGQVHVAGRMGVDVDLRLPAPSRSSPSIASLQGQFSLTGAAKMLTFAFDNLQAGKKQQQTLEGVQVQIVPPAALPASPLPIEVYVVNPPGGPTFESFQSWLDYNRISLIRKNQTLSPLRDDVQDLMQQTATHAGMCYFFTRDIPANLNGWTLRYRTPSPLVDLPVSCTFEKIALP